MWLWKFFRKFSLPCSLVLGAVGYLIFANVPFLAPNLYSTALSTK